LSDYGELLPALYGLDQVNGWSIGMRAVTHALLDRASLPPGPILELGAGSGLFNAELQRRFADRLVGGVDLHPLALAYARQAGPEPPRLLRADLQQLPVAAATVSAILALDTFDQLGVDVATAISESWRVLQPGGLILLRVSAHPWLEGAHDTAFNTGRRFRRSDLVSGLVAAGFCVNRITYANALLSPPLVLLRLLERWGWLTLPETELADSPANRLLAAALGLEARWLAYGNFGFGISLYALATKQQDRG
jgi:SAM-dependent methyltransferase